MASKKGPLSRAETFYITEHAKYGKDIAEIAKELDRPIKSIEKCFTTAKTETNRPLTVGDQFARHKGSIVMTENASSMSDTTKSKCLKRPNNCVTRIKE